jgi:predicted alpha/beta superfamily hydrolase
LIAVFINHPAPFFGAEAYATMAGKELPAIIDEKYRTIREAAGRAHIGCALSGYATILTALRHSDMTGMLGVQSPWMVEVEAISSMMGHASEAPLTVYIDWCTYDIRSSLEGWSMSDAGRKLDAAFRKNGYAPVGGEAHDGTGAPSYRNRTDDLLVALFPRANAE